MDSLQELKHKNIKYKEKNSLQNANLKVRRDAGEPSKVYANNMGEMISLLKTNLNINKLNTVQSDRGDLVSDKTGELHKEKITINDLFTNKIIEDSQREEETGVSKINSKVQKTNINNLPTGKIITKINKTLKGNIDANLQNTYAHRIIDFERKINLNTKIGKAKIENKKGAANHKPIEHKLSVGKDLYIREDTTLTSPDLHENDNAKVSEIPPLEVNDKTHSKAKSIVVKIPKNVSNSKINSPDSKSNENIAQSNVSSEFNEQNTYKKLQQTKETNFSQKLFQGKVRDKMQNDAKRDSRFKTPNNVNNILSKTILNNVPKTRINKRTKLPKLSNVKSKDEVLGNPSFRKERIVLKQKPKLKLKKLWQKKKEDSPPTEVAKLVPNSVDKHTKLYYDAWVNTTLAAVLKGKNNLPLDKQPVLKYFTKPHQERNENRTLVSEDLKNESLIGTIKINRKKKL